MGSNELKRFQFETEVLASFVENLEDLAIRIFASVQSAIEGKPWVESPSIKVEKAP